MTAFLIRQFDPVSRDRWFKTICLLAALALPVLTFAFFIQLSINAFPAFKTFGVSFLFSTEWDPAMEQFGALPAITGTLLTTGIAVFIAVPLAFVTALFLVDAPPWIGQPLSYALDLLAAVPSVIYGMWGLFVLAPLMQSYVQPFLAETLGLKHIPFIGGDYTGFGFFTAGLILSLMILPYISAIMRDVFQMTPSVLRESAYGIGCTKWETATDIVMKYGIRGLLGGVFIGLGRALGETMAVLFVIGNTALMPSSIFSAGTTISATLANNFAEADGLLRSVLFALGFILLMMSFGVQVLAQYYLIAAGRKRGEAR